MRSIDYMRTTKRKKNEVYAIGNFIIMMNAKQTEKEKSLFSLSLFLVFSYYFLFSCYTLQPGLARIFLSFLIITSVDWRYFLLRNHLGVKHLSFYFLRVQGFISLSNVFFQRLYRHL